jgi:predicted small lipoprotein YifL
MSRRLLPLAAALVALSLAAAACGGGGPLSHGDYQKKLDQISADLQKQSAVFTNSGNVSSLDDLKKLAPKFRQAADATDQVAQELDGVEPPDDAATANQALVDNLPKVGDDFREFADAAESGDIQKLQEIGTQFNKQTAPGIKEVTAALEDLKKAGYTVQNG